MLRKYLTSSLRLSTNSFKKSLRFFSVVPQQDTGVKKVHGGLKDSDRIFTNLYRDGDPFVEGALKRVNKN
jgi:hypothetical protein